MKPVTTKCPCCHYKVPLPLFRIMLLVYIGLGIEIGYIVWGRIL